MKSLHVRRLVVCSHGTRSEAPGGFLGLHLGSTADQVVRHARCPVVVVPVEGNDDPSDLDTQLAPDGWSARWWWGEVGRWRAWTAPR